MILTYVALWRVWHMLPAQASQAFGDLWLTELLIEVCSLYTCLGYQALKGYRR